MDGPVRNKERRNSEDKPDHVGSYCTNEIPYKYCVCVSPQGKAPALRWGGVGWDTEGGRKKRGA